MPSKTPKQAKFMRAIAHGWTPDRMKSPPSRAVAQEFVEADRKYSGGFAENRYWTGGLAAMDEVNSGIDETLNWLKGGPVNYYEEGGDVRPGHPEGPNPFEGRNMPSNYARWERENHADAPPPPPSEVEPEAPGFWETLLSYAKGPGQRSGEDLAELEAETGEAHGGRVRYQTGGLAMAAPAGGIPPWIQPTGAGPGGMLPPEYMEPEGYQFGGMASRFGGMRQRGGGGQYRGVPPQRGGIQRGGGRPGMFGSRWGARQPGPDPHQGRTGPGGMGGLAAMMRRATGRQTYQDVVDRGEGGINPMMESGERMYGGPGGPPTVGINPPPSGPFRPPVGREVIGGSGKLGDPYQYGRSSGGKPRPGPGMMPPRQVPPSPPRGGEGIPGGPMVPPNQRGYLQRQRMMNRPPANVGGGANRIGMQDQQGGLARALQRGTGRPPMSRRMAFGRGASR